MVPARGDAARVRHGGFLARARADLGRRDHRLRLSRLQGARAPTGEEAGPGRGAWRGRAAAAPGQAGAGADGVRESAAVPGGGPRQRAAGGAGGSPRARRAGPGVPSMRLSRQALLAAALWVAAPLARAELVDRIAAVVNNDIITL